MISFIIIFIIIFIVLVFLAVIATVGAGKPVTEKKQSTFPSIKPYVNTKLRYLVRGVWANKNGIREFQALKKGDIVNVKFDKYNEFDRNALGVYSENNTLLGYIERNQRKLIKTLLENPIVLARVTRCDTDYSHPDPRYQYTLTIELWAGFSEEEILNERNKLLAKSLN